MHNSRIVLNPENDEVSNQHFAMHSTLKLQCYHQVKVQSIVNPDPQWLLTF